MTAEDFSWADTNVNLPSGPNSIYSLYSPSHNQLLQEPQSPAEGRDESVIVFIVFIQYRSATVM